MRGRPNHGRSEGASFGFDVIIDFLTVGILIFTIGFAIIFTIGSLLIIGVGLIIGSGIRILMKIINVGVLDEVVGKLLPLPLADTLMLGQFLQE